MAKMSLKNAVLTIKDGAGSPITVTCKIGDGDLSWTEAQNIEYELDRGNLDPTLVREGDDVPIEVSFDIVWEYYEGSGTVYTPHDILTNRDMSSSNDDRQEGSTFTSTGDSCTPYAVDLTFTITNNCGSGSNETMVFRDFRYERISGSARSGQISCSGKCPTRYANSTRS